MTEKENKKTEQRVMTPEEVAAELNICLLNSWRVKNAMYQRQFELESIRDQRYVR